MERVELGKKVTCHCGQSVLSIILESGLRELRRCDCSLCRRKGYINCSVELEELQIIEGDMLNSYDYKGAKHFFCSICGIHTHHQRRSNPNQYGVNVGCIDGVNPSKLGEIIWKDGVNHPKDR
jgi:hypothetical protein